MKTRIEYMDKQHRICMAKLYEIVTSLDKDERKIKQLAEESNMLEAWIKELKGLPKQPAYTDSMTGLMY